VLDQWRTPKVGQMNLQTDLVGPSVMLQINVDRRHPHRVLPLRCAPHVESEDFPTSYGILIAGLERDVLQRPV
jgi:hypothetical protein